MIALRSAGFNNVDIKKATEKGILVARVPAYSPYAVAEHATALLLSVVRKYITPMLEQENLTFLFKA